MQFTDTASAGNGGVATASANGGAVAIGDVNSGGNAGSAIGIGDTWGGPVAVDGGTMANSTTLSISANGGTAHCGRLRRQLQPGLRQLERAGVSPVVLERRHSGRADSALPECFLCLRD